MRPTLWAALLISISLIIALVGCELESMDRMLSATPIAIAPSQAVTESLTEPVLPATPVAETSTPALSQQPTASPTIILPSPTFALLPVRPRDFQNASSSYDPDTEALLLENGYQANIINVEPGRRGLRASQRSYANSIWTRDLDYAISGYSYALGDMRVMRENIELFLARVAPDGIAPETIYIQGSRLDYENRQAWDSLPNLIHAIYVYSAKTGDRDFYQAQRATVLLIGQRMVAMDSDGDGLPDDQNFPYGYYDSLSNSVMHTYAIAKFYAAYNELAELEQIAGGDSLPWELRAAQLRAGFHRDVSEGGYWLPGQLWPIAWLQSDGSPVNILETYGIFSALRNGLIGPVDGERYHSLLTVLHDRLPELIDTPTPMRLALGGYEKSMRRPVDPPVPIWMLDASAPWVVGLAAPAYAAAGYRNDALTLMQAYTAMAQTTTPPVLEFAAGPDARYGAGNSGDGGRTWDSAAWFSAVYGGHYGLTMTPAALVVQPYPFFDLAADGVQNLSYQGAYVQMTLDVGSMTYRILADEAIHVRLRPMGAAVQLRLNGGDLVSEVSLVLQPGQEYVVESIL
ncbi:hypothetical protein EKD04_005530 [Chloroflexales bacterium ZM16-3]|nr:hypothetical protein [Chloroflexales bacterium ZM16-3]